MAQGIRKNNDTILWLPLHKKMKFSIKVCSVNVTKSVANCGFGHIY